MNMRHIALPIAADHPAFAGHFPGMPIVPGVVLLDEALYAIGIALSRDLSACQVSTVKFLSPVHPGDAIQLNFDALDNGTIKFDIVNGERKIATGSLRVQKGG
jgi:3-hydroxyacyl-[acyl-carrier-protein] dehydratase